VRAAARWLVGAAAAVLVVEGVARLCAAFVVREPVVPAAVGRFDAWLGWALEPGARGVSRRTGRPVEYRINSRGLRDDETSDDKPAGVVRIVALGASRTFGYGLPIEEHFTRLLERDCPGVEVVNMGVDGFGVDQALLQLEHEGWRYQPDLVLAYVDTLDDRHLHVVRWGRPKPRFVLEGDALVLTGSPVTAPFLEGALHRWLAARSAAYELIAVRGRAVVAGRRAGPPPGGAGGIERAGARGRPARADADELGARIVAEMARASARHGARFALITEVGALHERMVREGIASLDVSARLADPSLALPGGLGHLSAARNRVLARAIARFLDARDMLPGSVACAVDGGRAAHGARADHGCGPVGPDL
jgi:hypothetical protein